MKRKDEQTVTAARVTMIPITTVEQLQAAVREQSHVSACGGRTKTALSAGATLDLSGLNGVVEYEPSEYTFTARTGTRLADIQSLLASHGQFMPFDPVLVRAGATLGGAIASGISGPGRFRYGGLRDFLLGVYLVNGDGQIVRGGGKVVKNAAGFDIPKLVVGSLGRFGILTEATFKVFPRPEAYATVQIECGSLDSALDDMLRVATSPAEAACLELLPPGKLLIRVGGMRTALPQRIDRLRQLCRGKVEVFDDEDDQRCWDAEREFVWRPADQRLVRMPIAPHEIVKLEQRLTSSAAGPRRYSIGGHLLWLCWPGTSEWSPLEAIAGEFNRSALVVMGVRHPPLINYVENEFGSRLVKVFDPRNRFSA